MIVVEKKNILRSRVFAGVLAVLIVVIMAAVVTPRLFALPALTITSCADFATYFPDDVTNADANITLGNDIDCSGVGTMSPLFIDGAFTGTFDGAGYTISNLTILGTASSQTGLFNATNGADFYDINFDTVSVTGTYSYGSVGVLVGDGEGAVIDNVHVTNGDVDGDHYVGGIVGNIAAYDSPTMGITDSSYAGTVNGMEDVGGLVGSAYSDTGYESFFTGNDTSNMRIEIDGGNDISGAGGMIGSFCVNGPSLVANNTTYAPDLWPLVESYGATANTIGGLIGDLACGDTGIDYEAYGNTVLGTRVSGTGWIGGMYGEIDITADGNDSVRIHDEHLTVDIYSPEARAGGFTSYAAVYDAVATSGPALRMTNISSTGNVEAMDNSGGLIGTMGAYGPNCSTNPEILLVEKAYATGDVTGLENTSFSSSYAMGGFAGYAGSECVTVREAYATGDVYIDTDDDSQPYDFGGFIGYAGLTIEDSFARGSVYLSDVEGAYYDLPDILGGFIGFVSDEQISNNIYATGSTYQSEYNYGGLYGCDNYGTPVTGGYWDVETSGTPIDSGAGCDTGATAGTGLTTSAMTTQSSFVGYDFTNVWYLNPAANDGYPCLRFSQECITGDIDGDGISNAEENAGPNNGDGNNDGIRDSDQSNVTTVYNPGTDTYTTVETDDGATITDVTVTDESDHSTQDDLYDYPGGFVSPTIEPENPGDSVDVTIIYHGTDPDDPVVVTYDPEGETYTDESEPEYVYDPAVIDGDESGTVTFSPTDGGNGDGDEVSDGVIIVNPIGIGAAPGEATDGGADGEDAVIPGAPNTGADQANGTVVLAAGALGALLVGIGGFTAVRMRSRL